MKHLKTFAKVILTIAVCVAFVLMTAEAQTIGAQLCVTLGACCMLLLSGKALDWLGGIEDIPEE